MQASIREGMKVTCSDGVRIGTVREIRDSEFVVMRPLGRNLFIPFDAAADVAGDTIKLNVPASQVNKMGWETPKPERPAA